MTYQPGIPTGFVDLDEDYQNIQDNFTVLNNVFQVDHTAYNNNTAQKGYHTNIHQIPFSTTTSNPPNNQPVTAPTNTPGYGQIFQAQINDGIVSDEALYFLSGGNRLTQFTRNFQPVILQNGYTFVPGGLIFQWGVVNSTFAGTVIFSASGNIAFPANCFSVWTQPFQPGPVNASQATVNVKINTTVSFTWAWSGSTSGFTGFYWFAIGN